MGPRKSGAWSFECGEQPGGLHVNEALFLVQIEEVDTGELIEEPNRPGKMAITAFDRLAQPCVRFDSKDIIQWQEENCSCGRTFRVSCCEHGTLPRAQLKAKRFRDLRKQGGE